MNQRAAKLLNDKAEQQAKPSENKTTSVLLDKIRLSKLDEVTKQKAPYEVSMVLYGATGLIMLT